LKIINNEDDPESVNRRLAELFRAATRFRADPFCKRRVLVRVERLARTRLPQFWLRPAVIAALLVSGSAAAALGHRYISPSGSFGFSPSFVDRRRVVATAVPAPSQGVPRVDPSLATEQAPTPAGAVPPESARARPYISDDPLTVAEAIRALRTEHDTARAEHLLADYLTRYPRGLLSEEALALSIEAAATEHDPRAIANARRYLASFPHGKYGAFARSVVDARE
jgi:hypothetical protein